MTKRFDDLTVLHQAQDTTAVSDAAAASGKIRPESALPFTCGSHATRQSNFGGYAAKIFAADTLTVAAVRGQGIDEAGACLRNAHYIVHACNAYPKLVAELKRLCAEIPMQFGCEIPCSNQVLRELGEL